MRIRKDKLKEKLDRLYRLYNKREYVDPDPLLFLYDYPRTEDREVVGMIASCLAYGRVAMIMKTVGAVLEKMGPSPRDFVAGARREDLENTFKGFKYRFATEEHLSNLILGMQVVLNAYNSLEACFGAGGISGGAAQGLGRLYRTISTAGDAGHLLADPEKTSACKRSHLFLRWMVRCDGVDPGGWAGVSPAQLVYPVDTHMYKIGTLLGFTRRKSADKQCAVEITRGFKRLNPPDPVKYDFALTRFGIRQQFEIEDLKTFIRKDDD
ncbi:MAG: TIGR02757 family protein [Desulfobacter sp.]|nr:MAG: TIGR02757 family protein [Desulfobacter sp.]